MKNFIILLALVTLNIVMKANAQTINTIAGNGIVAFTGDGGPATSASLVPSAITKDKFGNIYFTDDNAHRVRKISAAGIITTVAGNGSTAYVSDGIAATSTAIDPKGVAVDTLGNIYICDQGNNRIRKVNTSGIISTIAGTGVAGYSGDGSFAISAQIKLPYRITIDKRGNLYFTGDNRVRKISTSGMISLVTGNGSSGSSADGVIATMPSVSVNAYGIAVDTFSNVYVADKLNYRIRKINNATGIITTIAGNGVVGSGGDGGAATSANLRDPYDVALDSLGNIYISDYGNYKIRKVNTSGTISTFAGNGVVGFSGDGGPATAAKISANWGITADYYGVIMSDGNDRIRRVCFGMTNPSISVVSTDTTVCAGVSVTYTSTVASGGSAPTYKWLVNGILSGTGRTFSYVPSNGDVVKCIVKSNATCAFPDTAVSSSITMTVNPTVTPTISISSSDTAVCAGTSINLTSSISHGGTSPAYRWTVNGATVGTANTYSYVPSNGDTIKCVLTSDATCAAPAIVQSNRVRITVHPMPHIYTFASSGSYVDTTWTSLSGSETGVSYQICSGSGAYGSAIAGTGSALTSPITSTGNYYVVATSTFGCADTTNSISLTITSSTTSIGTLPSGQELAYPNPFTTFLDFRAPSIVRIYDLTGKLVYSNGEATTHIRLDLWPGVYLVEIDRKIIQRFIKQ